ncbi:hypothetical protein [Seleniivibrio woodruffii]|nr:hypothetical protein [Seleniivibrio woodruffii]
MNHTFLILTFVAIAFFGLFGIGYAQNGNSEAENNTSSAMSCDSYSGCISLGLKERGAGKESVLLYFSESVKESRYNIFDNISLRLSSNTCPPIISVYKKVNNVNYIMDVFTGNQSNGCVKYFANVTGDNRDRDSIVGQLEVTYCNDDELFESCRQGIIYSRINSFKNEKNKEQMPGTFPAQSQNLPMVNQQSDISNYNGNGQIPLQR